jgi:hypothetical protein
VYSMGNKLSLNTKIWIFYVKVHIIINIIFPVIITFFLVDTVRFLFIINFSIIYIFMISRQ